MSRQQSKHNRNSGDSSFEQSEDNSQLFRADIGSTGIYSGFSPGEKVDRLHTRDGKQAWVSGYVVCDSRQVSTVSGKITIKIPTREGYVPIWAESVINSATGSYKPLLLPASELRPHADDAVEFHAFFNT